MKVYVAGGSDERLTVVRPFIDRLLAAGVIVTHDWTRCEGYDFEPTEEQRRVYAQADADGVAMSDVLWLVAPEAKSEGAGSELGIAHGTGTYSVVSGQRARRNLFALLANEIHETHEAAYEAIVARMMGGAA